MLTRTPSIRSLALAAGLFALAAHARAQSNTNETEPNNTAAAANGPIVMSSSDTITGDAAGSADVFLIQTAAAPLGIYRHELIMSMPGLATYPSGTGVPTLTITPGVSQSDGFLNPVNGNPSIQTGNSTTQPLAAPGMRSVAWYGFGKQEKRYVTVGTGTSSSTGYVLTLTDTAVTTSSPIPIVDAGTVAGGVMNITTVGSGGDVASTTGTKLWIYDASLNAMPGYGNHRKSGFPATTSVLVRDFPNSGDYYLAIGIAGTSAGVLANDQLEPRDDTILTDQLMPFPNAVAEAYASYDVNQTLAVTITDGAGVAHSLPTITKTLRAQIIWVKFHVDTTGADIGACCKNDGSCAAASNAGCALIAGATYHSVDTCAVTTCPQPPLGRCCRNDGSCIMIPQFACTAVNAQWYSAGSCSAPCPATLTTAPTYGGWGGSSLGNAGCVFLDLTATNSLDVVGFDLSIATTVGTAQMVQVWTRPGSYLGFDNSSSGWTQQGPTYNFTSVGQIPPAHVTLSAPLHIDAGQTVGFCIGAISVSPANTFLRYIDTNEQNLGVPLNYSNSDLSLNSDRTRTALFGGTSNAPRGFAGRVYYNPVLPGVCCRGSTCNTSISQAACTATAPTGALFVPAGACNSGGSATTPCCYADYNKAGGITVQDIFDFLNSWFAGDPSAIFGGDGTAASGPLTVQNIFDFLNAWFAGGC
jgi:hypothetical protein